MVDQRENHLPLSLPPFPSLGLRLPWKTRVLDMFKFRTTSPWSFLSFLPFSEPGSFFFFLFSLHKMDGLCGVSWIMLHLFVQPDFAGIEWKR